MRLRRLLAKSTAAAQKQQQAVVLPDSSSGPRHSQYMPQISIIHAIARQMRLPVRVGLPMVVFMTLRI